MNAAADMQQSALRLNEPMARHTSWRVGGPADRYFAATSRQQLQNFIADLPADEPLTWVGLGSNLLVRDGGIRGTVIALAQGLDRISHDREGMVHADAGAHCARLAKFCAQQSLAGLGFLIGVPGTVGGALAMNAGAHGGETWPQVDEVEVLFRDGRIEWLAAADFEYGYRQVQLPRGFAGFVGVRFALSVDQGGRAALEMKQWLARRKATQPVGKPSCGSVFRNPPGDHAARLIEHCGLKGQRIGGAVVSEMHANFIINEADATAADIEALIAQVQATVQQRTGIALQAEVRVVGEAMPGVAP